jgi:hypothetical protein
VRSQIALRVGVELRAATGAAEVKRLALEIAVVGRLGRIDAHPADGVLHQLGERELAGVVVRGQTSDSIPWGGMYIYPRLV